jgi:hypothetical protein
MFKVKEEISDTEEMEHEPPTFTTPKLVNKMCAEGNSDSATPVSRLNSILDSISQPLPGDLIFLYALTSVFNI